EADGPTRIARAAALLKAQLMPALATHFTTELYTVGDGLAAANLDRLNADAPRTDLTGALAAVRERYRGQRVAGIVLLSDGGDTGPAGGGRPAWSSASDGEGSGGGPPVFTIGIGSPDGVRDREVAGITAGDPRLDHASVDLHVTAISSGFGRTPFQVRVLANGRLLDTRRVVP